MKPIIKASALKPLLASIVLAGSGFSNAVPLTNLSSAGATATQNSLGIFIDSWLTDNSALASDTGLAGELYDLCVSYAAVIDAADTTSEIADALTLLDFVSNEEIAAVGSGFTDTGHDQIISVMGRLQSLRTGTPGIADSNHLQFSSGGAAGADFSQLSYYANVSYGEGDKNRTRNEQGFEFDSKALTIGTDYRFADDIVGGVALGFGQSDVSVDGNLGSTDSDTLSLTLYGSYYKDNWYADGSLGYAQHSYDSVRNLPVASLLLIGAPVDQYLGSSTDGDSISWSLGGGYTQVIGGWNADYSLRLNGVDATVDGYNEQGGSLALSVNEQKVKSLQAVLGAQVRKAINTRWGVASPYVGVELHQEFEDETRVVTARYQFDAGNNQFSFVSDDADSSYFLVSAGASFVLVQGRQLFVNLDHVEGLSAVNSDTLTAGMRLEF